jgi:hypothetical protein
MGIETTNRMEIKEFCGAPWPSKVLKRKERNPYCPLLPQRMYAKVFCFTASFSKTLPLRNEGLMLCDSLEGISRRVAIAVVLDPSQLLAA